MNKMNEVGQAFHVEGIAHAEVQREARECV